MRFPWSLRRSVPRESRSRNLQRAPRDGSRESLATAVRSGVDTVPDDGPTLELPALGRRELEERGLGTEESAEREPVPSAIPDPEPVSSDRGPDRSAVDDPAPEPPVQVPSAPVAAPRWKQDLKKVPFARTPLARSVVRFLRHDPAAVQTLPEAVVDIPPYLVDFLARVGVSLCAASETTDRTETELHELAVAYELHDARFFVLPTGVFTRLAKGPTTDVDFASVQNRVLRLDQTSDVYALIERTKREKPPPREALADLDRILVARSRFNEFTRMLARAVVAVGLGMVLGLSWQGLVLGAGLAVLIGAMNVVVERSERLSMAFPVVSAAIATILVTVIAPGFAPDEALRLVVPPLVAFLPGTALTIGAIELAAGEIVAGATRLVSGINSLVLLAFGVFVGTVLSPMDWGGTTGASIPVWYAGLGVAVFGIGQFVFSSAPRRSFWWIIMALYLTWGAQTVASHVVVGTSSGVVGAFVGGLVVVPVAHLIASRGGPPAQVTYLPAFWILVPGAIGFTGVSELFGATGTMGINDIVSTFLTIIAIAMGVLVASSFSRERFQESRPIW